MGGVWESWRVLQLLHAQSLVTLHQAAANTHAQTEGSERLMKLIRREQKRWTDVRLFEKGSGVSTDVEREEDEKQRCASKPVQY